MTNPFGPTIERLEAVIRLQRSILDGCRVDLADHEAWVSNIHNQIVTAEDAIACHMRAIEILRAQA